MNDLDYVFYILGEIKILSTPYHGFAPHKSLQDSNGVYTRNFGEEPFRKTVPTHPRLSTGRAFCGTG